MYLATKAMMLVMEYLIYAIQDNNSLINKDELKDICNDLSHKYII